VSAAWSRCLGSIARRARDSVAPLQRSSAGWMPARMERLSGGVGRRHPVTIRKALLMAGSIRRLSALRHQTGAQYSGFESPSTCMITRSSAYAYFLETVVGRSEMYLLKRRGARTDPCGTPFLRRRNLLFAISSGIGEAAIAKNLHDH